MKTYKKKRSGFTIIELMIVLVIVAILVGIAYPSYIQYVRKARRGEAQQLLLNWAINQEIWRSNHTSYNFIIDPTSPDHIIPGHDDYDFTPSNVTATAYTLTAAAKNGNDQENDVARNSTPCATITLNQFGAKTDPACWD